MSKQKFYEALSLIGKIEQKVLLEDYMRDNMGVELKVTSYKNGSPVYMGNCPIHDERTPSFALYGYNQTYYCFGCLHEDEVVWTTNGLIPIKEINIGDTVIDIKGNYQKVLDKVKKKRSILQISTLNFLNSTLLSPDHHCIYSDDYTNIKECLTEELKEGYMCITPIIENNKRKIGDIKANKDLCELYGIVMLYHSYNYLNGNICFTLDENIIPIHYMKNLLYMVGIDDYNINYLNNSYVVTISKSIHEKYPDLIKFINLDFNKTECLFWPQPLQKQFIKYYKYNFHLNEFSELEYEFLYQILIQSGYLKSECGYIGATEYFFDPIVSIDDYDDGKIHTVYDIEVENTHTFLTRNFITHNCKSSGGLVNMVQKTSGWTWYQTINYFATQLGLDCNISEKDMIAILEKDYRDKFQINIDRFEPNAVNWHISNYGKEIYDKFKTNKRIIKAIDLLYRALDRALVSNDRALIYKLREEVFPQFKSRISNFLDREDKMDDIILNNSNCNSCFMRYNVNNVNIGFGNKNASVVIVTEKNNEEIFNIKKTIIDKVGDDSGVWYDYVYSCSSNNLVPYKEGHHCSNLWLKNKIKTINPKIVMIFGENAFKIFMGNKDILLENYIGHSNKVDNIDNIYFNYNYMDKNFESILDKFIFENISYIKNE